MDPHPVIVTIRDSRDHIKVLYYSYYTTMTGLGVFLRLSFLVSGRWNLEPFGLEAEF